MIVIIKGRQRQYKTTTAVAAVMELVMHGGYDVSDIISNIHLFKPGQVRSMTPEQYLNLGEIEREMYEHCAKNHVTELEAYHYLNNNGIRQYVTQMVTRGFRHKIILIDEIDRVFSHRFWHDKSQTEALLGLWQDEKLFNYIIGTAHLGMSVDSLIRESMQIEVISEALIRGKTVGLTIMNALQMRVFEQTFENVPLVQRMFYTYEPVK